ncbi:hypothetical protein [Brevundimonas sp.]|uniref:hypothetical protein n=1 Tax=Brevundimonas sp. TaxID=1871086 RepID=UPI003511D19C
MTPDDTLKAFLAAGTPGPRDATFEFAVAERVARRRFWMSQLALLPWVLVAGLLAVFAWPILEIMGPALAPLAEQVGMIGGVAVLTLATAGLLVRRLRPS